MRSLVYVMELLLASTLQIQQAIASCSGLSLEVQHDKYFFFTSQVWFDQSQAYKLHVSCDAFLGQLHEW